MSRLLFPLMLVATIAKAGVVPPPCPPSSPPQLPPSFRYNGLSSGCSAGRPPVCFAGETIQFKVGDGLPWDCFINYVWQFGATTTVGGANMAHSFASAGSYTVTATLPGNPPITVSTIVQVTDVGTIPAVSDPTLLVLIASLAAVALHALKR